MLLCWQVSASRDKGDRIISVAMEICNSITFFLHVIWMYVKVITKQYVRNITEMPSFYKWFYKISQVVAIAILPLRLTRKWLRIMKRPQVLPFYKKESLLICQWTLNHRCCRDRHSTVGHMNPYESCLAATFIEMNSDRLNMWRHSQLLSWDSLK